jgi:hypothetical protein
MTVIDRNAPPSEPRVLRGRTAIAEYLDETCGRDMTHRLERVVVSGDTAAFAQACRYPDGTRVLCLAMLDLRELHVGDSGIGRLVLQPGSGHDAWVVGDEEVVVVDWWGATNYARS